MGHEDQFPPPRLSGRSVFSEETFGGRCGNEKDASKMIIGITGCDGPGGPPGVVADSGPVKDARSAAHERDCRPIRRASAKAGEDALAYGS